jgi:ABC-type glycerol-3-phosphate transport system permease component
MSARRLPLPATTLRYVALTMGALVMITPFLYMLSTSFKAQQYVLKIPPQFIPDPATLSNYERILTRLDFGQFFLNSLVVAVASTTLAVLLSAMMAYGFARYRFPGRELLFRVLLLGLMIPAMMLIVPQFVLAKFLGLIDSLPGLIVFYVAGNLALNTFLLRGFFETLPDELDQAMHVDGAGHWRRFWNLALPLSRPALATATIFTFLASWDEFAWALTIITTPENQTLPIAIALLHGPRGTQWGLVFAASVLAVLPVIAVFLIFQRHFVQGLTAGAVKG